jgi:hypothetical protein
MNVDGAEAPFADPPARAYNARMAARIGGFVRRFHASDRTIAVLLAILSLSQVSPANLRAFAVVDGVLTTQDLPGSGRALPASSAADFDADGTQEALAVESGRAALRRGAQIVWSSPPVWDVREARITDLNHDDKPEIALLLWRDFAPWPIDAYLVSPGRIADFHDSQDRSCHLILIGWRRGRYQEVWAGSALSRPLLAFDAADTDGDGDQELAALEARYDDPPDRGRSVSVWSWNGFGFTLEGRADTARVSSLRVIHVPAGFDLLVAQEAIWRSR